MVFHSFAEIIKGGPGPVIKGPGPVVKGPGPVIKGPGTNYSRSCLWIHDSVNTLL